MNFFKEKEPEKVNNHVVRTIIEAKYDIKDLTLEELKLIRSALLESSSPYYYGMSSRKEECKSLLDKIQL